MKIITVNVLLEVFSMPLVAGLQATGNIKAYQLTISGLYLFVIPVSYLLLKLGCPPATPMIVNQTLVFLSIAPRLLLCHRHYRLSLRKYCLHVIGHVFATTAICYLAGIEVIRFFSPSSSFQSVAVTVALNILICLVIIFFIGLTRQERIYIIETIKNAINRRMNYGKIDFKKGHKEN
ncbi:MAG: hypothetical protein LUC49_02680 [Prevotella sp.]|nr:hypothetical protein [Prevotella sp.]